MYRQTTRSIEVIVEPFFLDEHSSPKDSHYLWGYQVRIVNRGHDTVQLIRRNWRISDKAGQSRLVSGQGVVGEQPTLKPGESFEYSSFAQLNTDSGIMAGTYEMLSDKGTFSVAIPAFSLDTHWSNAAYN